MAARAPASPPPACHACGQSGRRHLATVRGTDIWQCPHCGLATWDWQAFDFEAFYGEDYWKSPEIGKGYADYFALADAMSRTHAKRLAWIEKFAGPGAGSGRTLLDAGCGPGFFVRAAAQAGYQAFGVEVSDFAARFAREQLGQTVWQGRLEPGSLLPPGPAPAADGPPYDVVTLWDVVEHLPDPAASLAALGAVTRPGGLLALSTGDIGSLLARATGPAWHLYNLPEHLWFFTPASLRRLLERAGFEVLDQRYEVCWYTLRYLVERVESSLRLGRLFSPRLGPLGKVPLPVTLLDIVSLLARKRADR